jgi:hypothetical protein
MRRAYGYEAVELVAPHPISQPIAAMEREQLPQLRS